MKYEIDYIDTKKNLIAMQEWLNKNTDIHIINIESLDLVFRIWFYRE